MTVQNGKRIELSERVRWILLNSISTRRHLLEEDVAMFRKHNYERLADSVSIEIHELELLNEQLQDAATICLEMD